MCICVIEVGCGDEVGVSLVGVSTWHARTWAFVYDMWRKSVTQKSRAHRV